MVCSDGLNQAIGLRWSRLGRFAQDSVTHLFLSDFWRVERQVPQLCVHQYQQPQVIWNSLFCLTQSLHVCWFGLFKAWCSSGSDFPCSPAFRFEVSIWCGLTDKFAHCKQFSPIRGFSYITRMAIMGRISELLSLFHEVLVTGLWEAGKWDGTKCFGPTESLNILLVSHHGRCPSTYGLYA